ncbi:MAG: hypothetical protein MZV64_18045 [Ignavibacteriales bacterium]|nr:hypothetical protein [Ignavibacteriales bacterium]
MTRISRVRVLSDDGRIDETGVEVLDDRGAGDEDQGGRASTWTPRG